MRSLFLSLVLCASCFILSANARTECGIPNGSETYVVGGSEAGVLEFPWQISLRVRDNATGMYSHICGGSIISDQWIVTAAHCVMSGPYILVTGEHDEKKKNPYKEVHRISKIITHPRWNFNTIDYDMALIKLQTPLDLSGRQSHLAPVCLPHIGDSFSGQTCMATGWGLNRHREDFLPDIRSTILHKVPLVVSSQASCSANYRGVNIITNNMMCAGQYGGYGVCNGDSGGPLQCMTNGRYYLAGLSSYVVRCGSSQHPSVFARVAAFTSWMQLTMRTQ